NSRAFTSLALDYAVILVTIATAVRLNYTPTTLIAMIIVAGRQSALQGLVHSASHHALFSRRSVNNFFEILYAFPVFESVAVYRIQHLQHHRDFAKRAPDRYGYLHDVLGLSDRGVWHRTWQVFVRPILGFAGVVFVWDQARTLSRHPQ